MRRENTLDLSHVQRGDTLVGQAFDTVTDKTVLGMVAPIRALSVQTGDSIAGFALVFEKRLIVRDEFRGVVELLEQVASFLQVLSSG